MPPLPDRDYSVACGQLASRMGISLASARRKVDIRALKEGLRGVDDKIVLAGRMLEEVQQSGIDMGELFSAQLHTVGSDDNFMVED